ncbi:DUF397 domain-containing protein [Pseudonocardiaceae bacterium YIM PH 21723]|nr:DUF397 domain-containing protein [Pseudonocardiaceae bacterium YIM PH 21723]
MRLTDAVWRKSSYSGSDGGQCIELAIDDAIVGVRDSKNPGGGILAVGKGPFVSLLNTLKAGVLR